MSGSRVKSLVLAMASPGLAFCVCFAEAPVTLETLTSLRCGPRHDARGWVAGRDEAGTPYVFEDANADDVSVMTALGKAYDVPICAEYDQSRASARFPFVIEANQRLVDALDALKESSQGFAQWRLLHGRIVITFREQLENGPVFIMDRPVSVDIEASNWKDLLMQIEKAYNAQCDGVPLLIGTVCLGLDEEVPLVKAGETPPFRYQAEATFREIMLSIFEKTGDPSLRYGLSAHKTGQGGEPYDQLWISKPGCRQDYETEEEFVASRRSGEESQQRLDAYYEQINVAKKNRAAAEK